MFLRIILIACCALFCALPLPGFAEGQKPACCPFELKVTPYQATTPHAVRIATGTAFGSYWSHASGLRKQLNFSTKSEVLPEIEVLETTSPLHNIGEVLLGKADVGYSSLSMLQAAESKLSEVKLSEVKPSEVKPTLCLAFPLYETPLSWVLKENPGIKSLSDLPPGFTLGTGPEFSSTDWFFRQILTLLGKDVVATNASWIGLHQQFDAQEMNGLAYAAGVPNPQIKRLFRKSNLRVMGFSPEEMTLIQDKLHLHPYLILENSYQNQITPINSAVFWNYAITQCQVNEDWIYELTRLAIARSSELPRPRRPVLSEESKTEWIQTGGVPFHPGAIRYFKEQGIDLTAKN